MIEKRLRDFVSFCKLEVMGHDDNPQIRLLREVIDHAQLDEDQRVMLCFLFVLFDDLETASRLLMSGNPLAFDSRYMYHGPARKAQRGLPSSSQTARSLREVVSAMSHAPHELSKTFAGPSGRVSPEELWGRCFSVFGLLKQADEDLAYRFCATLNEALYWNMEPPAGRLYHGSGRVQEGLAYIGVQEAQLRVILMDNDVRIHCWPQLRGLVMDFLLLSEGKFYPGLNCDRAWQRFCGSKLQALFLKLYPGYTSTQPSIDRHLLTHYRDTGEVMSGV